MRLTSEYDDGLTLLISSSASTTIPANDVQAVTTPPPTIPSGYKIIGLVYVYPHSAHFIVGATSIGNDYTCSTWVKNTKNQAADVTLYVKFLARKE